MAGERFKGHGAGRAHLDLLYGQARLQRKMSMILTKMRRTRNLSRRPVLSSKQQFRGGIGPNRPRIGVAGCHVPLSQTSTMPRFAAGAGNRRAGLLKMFGDFVSELG